MCFLPPKTKRTENHQNAITFSRPLSRSVGPAPLCCTCFTFLTSFGRESCTTWTTTASRPSRSRARPYAECSARQNASSEPTRDAFQQQECRLAKTGASGARFCRKNRRPRPPPLSSSLAPRRISATSSSSALFLARAPTRKQPRLLLWEATWTCSGTCTSMVALGTS